MKYALGVLFSLVGFVSHGHADDYPTRPITMIVPFAAGGPTDSLARVLAQAMSEPLRQTVLVENVPGAGGSLGAQRLTRADADGYAILLTDLALPAGPLLNPNVKYDISKDFAPIGVVNAGPMILISKPGLAADASELFKLMRDKADKLTLGHSGVGSNSQMCGLFIQQTLGIKLTEIPYRGAGPAMNDMLAGQLDIMCEQSTTAIPQIEAQKVMAYGVTSPKRLAVFPNLPTLSEAGLTQFEFTVWHGLYAPPATPPAIIEKLNGALQTGLASPLARKRFEDAGRVEFSADQRSPDAHRKMLNFESQRLAEALGKAGLMDAKPVAR